MHASSLCTSATADVPIVSQVRQNHVNAQWLKQRDVFAIPEGKNGLSKAES